MNPPKYLRTIAYKFRGQLWWARQAVGESMMAAVTRSVGKKTGPVTLWWSECRYGHDVYTAKWFDPQAEVFEQCEVIIGP